MLAHPTLDQLNALGLHGLAKGFKDLEHKPEARGLDHAEWLGLLLEYEATLRRQKQFEARARAAKLRHGASVEDVDYQNPRGLDRALFLKLAACGWIEERRNILITGAAGLGKSWLACALGHKACRENISVLYARVPRLFADLAVVHGSPGYARLLRSLARVKLLILDDWGAGGAQRRPGARPARNHRGPLRQGLGRHHQPDSRRSLARPDRHSHPCRRHSRPRHSQRLPHRTRRREPAQAPPAFMTQHGASPTRWRHRRRDKAVDNGGLRYSAMESALKPAVAHRHPVRQKIPPPRGAEIRTALTDPVQANIIQSDPRKQTSGGRHQIGTLAGFKSECLRVQIGPAAQNAAAWHEAGRI
jgi:hypothetical protein